MTGEGSGDCARRRSNASPSSLRGGAAGGGTSSIDWPTISPSPTLPHEGGGTTITLGRAALLADSSGAIFWPAQATLLVADLHLEKGASRAVRGRLLPPYDTRETLARLGDVISRYTPARVIALGDSFHTGSAARVGRDELAMLQALQRDRAWCWLAGNHDPGVPKRVGGTVVHELELAGITLRHAPMSGGGVREISGHLHPAARLSIDGYSVRRRCFVGDGQRLVLPAFGAFAGGLNVLDEAFAPLFGGGSMSVWMLGRARIYPVAARHLRAD
jgi:DNA ligase-associated metallophosphoesterase